MAAARMIRRLKVCFGMSMACAITGLVCLLVSRRTQGVLFVAGIALALLCFVLFGYAVYLSPRVWKMLVAASKCSFGSAAEAEAFVLDVYGAVLLTKPRIGEPVSFKLALQTIAAESEYVPSVQLLEKAGVLLQHVGDVADGPELAKAALTIIARSKNATVRLYVQPIAEGRYGADKYPEIQRQAEECLGQLASASVVSHTPDNY